MGTNTMTYDALRALRDGLAEQERRQREGGHLVRYFPNEGPFRHELYPKHKAFFRAGGRYRERLFMAANRVGKSVCGGYEAACHATGQYPDWWEGKRFDRATDGWVAGDTGQTTRDILQNGLCGYPAATLGSGMIPAHLITQVRRRSGIADAFDTIKVAHINGGESIIGFKSYDQGRRSFQGTGKDWIWLDEECPQDVYGECLLRTMTTDGVLFVTFTPLLGMTTFIQDFLREAHRDANVHGMRI